MENQHSHNGIEHARSPLIAGTRIPVFSAQGIEKPELPILISVPHGGRHYPESVQQRMRDPAFSMIRLEDRLIDSVAQEVAAETGAPLIAANAPRAMLDLNRADDDMDWSMVADAPSDIRTHSRANRRARSGLGLIPRRLSGLGEVWRDQHDYAEVTERIATIHEPYHRCVSETLGMIRRRWGAALLLDLHSMPPLKKRHPDDQPAEFVIGDRFGASSDGMFSASVLRFLGRNRRRAAHNRPYAGGYVLDRHGKPSLAIHAIQVEVCRSVYLDKQMEEPNARWPVLVRLLSSLVRELATDVLSSARGQDMPQAAE